MKVPQLIDVVEVNNQLGEGVLWDARRGAVWWVDILGCQIYCYHLDTGRLQHWPTPERLGCFALVAGKDYLVAGFESGFAWFEPASGYLEWLHKVDAEQPQTRLNDGRADRQGRFWAGSVVEGDRSSGAMAALYCLDRELKYSKKLDGLAISNGLCWSPDSAWMYHTDTLTSRIDRYAFDRDNGDLSNRTTFANTLPGSDPDGSIVDAEGYVWNAQWGGSQVVRYSPTGEVDTVLPTPISQPTCVAFGGPQLQHLFVTSAAAGLDADALAAQPQAGNLFIYTTETRGLLDPEFQPCVDCP